MEDRLAYASGVSPRGVVDKDETRVCERVVPEAERREMLQLNGGQVLSPYFVRPRPLLHPRAPPEGLFAMYSLSPAFFSFLFLFFSFSFSFFFFLGCFFPWCCTSV